MPSGLRVCSLSRVRMAKEGSRWRPTSQAGRKPFDWPISANPPSPPSIFQPRPSLHFLDTMQIRTGDGIFSEYGSPSRPISPTSLTAPLNSKKTTTTRNEPGEIDKRTTTTGLRLEPGSHLQQQSVTLPPVIHLNSLIISLITSTMIKSHSSSAP